ncbi:TPA: hypothetical protein HA251_01805 [Candidatus Woesearchaeota archaeon]|nr:hypothetical protein [Candidatus Woesearchaeota archaeon]
MRTSDNLRAWIVAIDMGYGHQRAAYPFASIACEHIITANNDTIISAHERNAWERIRKYYELSSRLKDVPLIGKIAFGIVEKMQDIRPLFPIRNLSKPNYTALYFQKIIKKGFGSNLTKYMQQRDIPIITTIFLPALACQYAGVPCYCIVTDTDINRVWVPVDPKTCIITYFSPTRHTTMRLKEYGVPTERIVETGFPLPEENVGPNKTILKSDLLARLINLDPKGVFFNKYEPLLRKRLNIPARLRKKRLTPSSLQPYKTHPLTIAYLVGGSGAQAEIGISIISSLKERIIARDVRIILSAGTRIDVRQYFEREIARLGLSAHLDNSIIIVFAHEMNIYFETLNKALRTTDILWTKPSELSFYTGLGLPIIIAPPIGVHETFNKQWLEQLGAGFPQEDPSTVKDWLFYSMDDGRLAEAALRGYIDAPNSGTEYIKEYLRRNRSPRRNL